MLNVFGKGLIELLLILHDVHSYPDSSIRHLAHFASDHCPLLLTVASTVVPGPKPFQFEKFWLSCDHVFDVVCHAW